jgi:hypothetical protein
MKNTLMLIFGITSMFIFGCSKPQENEMKVVRDCTGTYLQVNNKDYRVCNLEKVENFADGVSVKASYRSLTECNGSANGQIICMMYHQHEGWIEVLTIK